MSENVERKSSKEREPEESLTYSRHKRKIEEMDAVWGSEEIGELVEGGHWMVG